MYSFLRPRSSLMIATIDCALDDAAAVVKRCNKIARTDNSNCSFLNELSQYMEAKSSALLPAGIIDRAKYINALLDVIEKKDVSNQMDFLKEENIIQLKGTFSQRLYDILVKRRNDLEDQFGYQSSNLAVFKK